MPQQSYPLLHELERHSGFSSQVLTAVTSTAPSFMYRSSQVYLFSKICACFGVSAFHAFLQTETPPGNTLLPALRYVLPTINILIFRRLVEYYITSLKILILLQLFLLIHFSSSYKNLLSVMTDLPLSPFKHYHPSIIYWVLCYRHVN